MEQSRASARRLAGAALLLPAALAALAVLLFTASLALGPVPLPASEIFPALFSDQDTLNAIIIQEIRLPRALLAAAIGATLGLSGAALQGLLRNPLAEPAILGTSGAAALGAVLTLSYGLAAAVPLALPFAGVAGALLSALVLFLIVGRDGGILTLILAGLAISSFTGAAVSLALNLAPSPFAALEIAFWLLGSLEDRSMTHLNLALPLILACWILLGIERRALDALTLGEDAATSLGYSPHRARGLIVLGVALGVGASVAVSGIIGFVGLMVPHLLRPLVGHRPSALHLPAALGGACLLLAADIAVRLIPSQQPIKLGVLTALLGAPFFIWLLTRARRAFL
jgi:iron complex transport system permease protein